MFQPTYLRNHFLIAMPGLADPNFYQTVTYLCEHSDKGALGIVINRPLKLTLRDMLTHLEIPLAARPGLSDVNVYFGGPVQPEHGFVLHTPLGTWDSSLKITDAIGLTTSRDILQALGGSNGPAEVLIALGYAGWGPGQLEREMAENSWLSGPADPDILFRRPVGERWFAAAAALGVDLRLLSNAAGHA